MATNNLSNAEVLKKLNAEFYHYDENGNKVLDLFKTLAECVYLQDGDEYTNLALQLANMVTSINSKTTQAEVEALLTQKWADEIEGVPDALNSIKELATAITENKTTIEAITALAATKVEKVEGYSLVADDKIAIINQLKASDLEVLAKAEANIVVGAILNGVDVPVDENKKMVITTQTTTFGATFPSNPKTGDCHILFND